MPRGGRRNGSGRPTGSKNRIPRPKEAVKRLNDIVAEMETGEYLFPMKIKNIPELQHNYCRQFTELRAFQ